MDTTPSFAKVVISVPPYRTFTYSVPHSLHNLVKIGSRVIVPLGNRQITGFVVEFLSSSDLLNVKEILDVPDPMPVLTSDLITLTSWISRYYMTNWGEVLRAAFPPLMHQKSIQKIILLSKPQSEIPLLKPDEKALLDFLQNTGNLILHTIRKQYQDVNLDFNLHQLKEKGVIQIIHEIGASKLKHKTQIQIHLENRPDEEILNKMQSRAPRQYEALQLLFNASDDLPRNNFPVPLSTLKQLEKAGWISMREKVQLRDPFDHLDIPPAKQMMLTGEQANALSEIQNCIREKIYKTFLLHGVTGSGKTQVYIEAIREVLKEGKSALVLIPEISLTPQAVMRYRSAFHSQTHVAVLHSRMSAGERYDAWQQIRDGKCQLVIGPRSVVFAPLQKPGLIVVDEEHEASYKQADPAPRYHARDVAVVRAMQGNFPVILGSATPSLESYFNARQKKYHLLTLTHRIDHIPMPKTKLVSSKTKNQNKRQVISYELKEAIEKSLKNEEQIILLQNRRGYSMFILCMECGYIEICKHCDITLTYHARTYQLVCHYCGFMKKAPDKCSQCGGQDLKYQGVGTQRVEDAIKNLFPKARILRMDLDTTSTKHAHANIIYAFENRQADILLGTQMVAKGHDFPGVSLVGIISADTGLIFPDFRASERSFQLITQAAGRAGRKQKQGNVIVQSLQPENPILRMTVTHDYQGFYHKEIQNRRMLNYPPFGRLLLIRFRGKKEEEVYRASVLFRQNLQEPPGMVVLGPVASPISKVRDQYRYQIILKISRQKDQNGNMIRHAAQTAWQKYNNQRIPHLVRIAMDIDPVDLL